jgi:MFS family permease
MTLGAYGRLVRTNRNFRLVWLAQIVSEIGDWFYALAIYSLILELTGRAELVGLAVVLQVLPSTLISPAAGVVNDRLSRRQVMIWCDLARMVIVLGMMLVRSRETVWLIYPLLFLETIGWGLFEPGRSAILPNITTAEELTAANTLSSTTWSFNLAVGSALGGLIAAAFGRNAVFLVNAASFAASAWLIGCMRFEEPHAQGHPPFRARDLVNFKPVTEGFRYILHDPRLSATTLVKCGLGLLGANLVLFPLLGERVFPMRSSTLDPARAGMLGMSLLMGARGMGALVGPFVSGAWAGNSQARMRRGIQAGFFLACLGYIGLSQAPTVWPAIAAIVMTHASGSTIWVFSTTLLQMQTEDRFRGRVFSAELGLHMLAISISGYVAGKLVDAGAPVRTAVLVCGLSLLFPGFAWLAAQRFWRTRS